MKMFRSTYPLVLLLVFGTALAGCGGGHHGPERYRERGLASWYGNEYHGRPTASGERFDQNALTAAHRTLPFGTIVQVTNLDNGRAVRVRINDRGPTKKKRVVDVSRRAAEDLKMIGPGIVPVEIEVVQWPKR